MGIDPVSLAITVALNAATMALTASQQIEGPRLSDLSVTVADYGTPLNYFKGTCRLEVPVFYAEPIAETRVQNKTKGGKYNEYRYSGTFAVVVADQQIEKFSRIWLDRRLAYDQSTPGPVDDSLNLRDYVRFYYGTETQDPDERMVAFIEAEEGVGTCPAYRGVSYIIFEELPLEIFGNRFPQVSVEAVSDAVPAYPTDVIAGGGGQFERFWISGFSPDQQRFFVSVGTVFTQYDLRTQTLVYSRTDLPQLELSITAGLFSDGTVYVVGNNERDLIIIDPNGTYEVLEDYFSSDMEGVFVRRDGDGNEHWIVRPPQGLTDAYYLDGERISTTDIFGTAFQLSHVCEDAYGDIWAIGRLAGPFLNSTSMYIWRLVSTSGRSAGGGFVEVTVPGVGPSPAVGITHSARNAHFVCRWDDRLYFIDDSDLSVKSFTTFSDYDVWVSPKQWAHIPPGSESAWFGPPAGSLINEVDLTDGSVIRQVDLSNWPGDFPSGAMYSSYLHAVLTFEVAQTDMTIRYLDRLSSDEVTLAEVWSVVADQVGLSGGDYDVSQLDQIVSGYSWSQGTGKQIIAPLLTYHDSFIRPSGFTIEGLKRGGVVEGTETNWEHFVRENEEDDALDLYEIEVLSESDLPRRVSITYADLDSELQPNTAVAQRAEQSVLTQRELTVDLTTLSETPDDAQAQADRLLRRPWIGSVKGRQILPPYLLEIQPGDVRNFRFDEDNAETCFVSSMIIRPNRTFEVRWERDFPAAATLRASPGAPALGRPVATVYDPVPSISFVMDAALLADAHDQSAPFMYTAAGPRSIGSWPGADLQVSDTGTVGTFSSGFDVFLSSEATQWAYVRTGSYLAAEGVPDRATELTVTPRANFQPTAAYEADLIADPTLNLALWGVPGRWEVIQFAAADLQSDGEWLIQPRLRGLRGTERFITQHEDGDYLVLYSGGIHRRSMGASALATSDFYRALTFGLTDFPYGADEVEFTGEANRPLSVAHLEVDRNLATGDVTIRWQRRTRIGASNIDGQDVPLGETAELYRVRILDINGNVVNMIETSNEEFEYDTYQQIEDFGSEQSNVRVTVVQVSPSLNLEGYAVEASG